MDVEATVTHELAAFLRTRRERLSPGDVALPAGSRRRRTPGLRREEVAELAGVSIDYIVRLEQGRGLNPSPDVLESLARALRLSDDERVYLFTLAGQRPTDRGRVPDVPAHTPTAQLVHDLSPLPAMLLDHRLDIVAWNREMSALLDLDTLAAPQLNALELCLFNPGQRAVYLDREQVIRDGVADLRAAWAAYPDDAQLSARIRSWCGRSEEFVRLWELRDVRVNGRGRKRLLHPLIGHVTLDFDVLHPLPDARERLVIYRAADAASQAALTRLTESPHVSQSSA
ncbi:MAG TPA: helix-turn-helix transcriptional regulator [Pseudonocardia sp.]